MSRRSLHPQHTPRPRPISINPVAWAVVARFNATLLAGGGATATLESWCSSLAARPVAITVRRVFCEAKVADPAQRLRLAVSSLALGSLAVCSSEPVLYRRVQLIGTHLGEDHVLSEADNWYVPSRLTPAMNDQLASSDIPFGRIVAALKPSRRTLACTFPEQPPTHIEAADPAKTAVLFDHRAVLSLSDGQPFAEVHEHYTSGLLAFASLRGEAANDSTISLQGQTEPHS